MTQSDKKYITLEQIVENVFGVTDVNAGPAYSVVFSPEDEQEYKIFDNTSWELFVPTTATGPIKTLKDLMQWSENENRGLMLLKGEHPTAELVEIHKNDTWTRSVVKLANIMWVDTTKEFYLDELLFKIARVGSVKGWMIHDSFDTDTFGRVRDQSLSIETSQVYMFLEALDENNHLALQPIPRDGDVLSGVVETHLATPDEFIHYGKTKDGGNVRYICDRDGDVTDYVQFMFDAQE